MPITTSIIILETLRTIHCFNGKTYNAYHLWVSDFLKRNQYSKRKLINYHQKLPPDTLEKFMI